MRVEACDDERSVATDKCIAVSSIERTCVCFDLLPDAILAVLLYLFSEMM